MVWAHASKKVETDTYEEVSKISPEDPFKNVTLKMVDQAKSVAIGNLKEVLQEYKNKNSTKDETLEIIKELVIVQKRGNTVGDATCGATNMYEAKIGSNVKYFYTSEE